jgi:uncharacterized protein YqgC (DUF456 family)
MYERVKTYTYMRPRLKKSLGVFLVLIGFIALIAPIIPGAPLVFIGLELMGIRFLFIDKLLGRAQSTIE